VFTMSTETVTDELLRSPVAFDAFRREALKSVAGNICSQWRVILQTPNPPFNFWGWLRVIRWPEKRDAKTLRGTSYGT
jgi:hypothetical protein